MAHSTLRESRVQNAASLGAVRKAHPFEPAKQIAGADRAIPARHFYSCRPELFMTPEALELLHPLQPAKRASQNLAYRWPRSSVPSRSKTTRPRAATAELPS